MIDYRPFIFFFGGGEDLGGGYFFSRNEQAILSSIDTSSSDECKKYNAYNESKGDSREAKGPKLMDEGKKRSPREREASGFL